MLKYFVLLGSILILSTFPSSVYSIPHSTQYKFYTIRGITANELRQQMDTRGPLSPQGQRHDAYTQWIVDWQYLYHQTHHCSLTEIQVQAQIIIIFPNWININQAHPSLQNQWNRFLTALRLHEQVHAQHGIQAAQDIFKILHQIPPHTTCLNLEKSANTQAQQIIHFYQQLDQEYDRQTNHGQTQGASFP